MTIELSRNGTHGLRPPRLPGLRRRLAMRLVLKGLGDKTIVVIPACCWSIIAGPFPLLGRSRCPSSTPPSRPRRRRRPASARRSTCKGDSETTVVAWAGDGGTFDIGLQALSGAAERNEDILYVCYDNEAYMNTGVQGSSATPCGAWTTTTPPGDPKSVREEGHHRDHGGAPHPLRGHRLDRLSRGPGAQGAEGRGDPRHPVPPHLRHLPDGLEGSERGQHPAGPAGRPARVFPLYEVEDGERYTLNPETKGYLVDEYLKTQGRFSHLSPAELDRIQEEVDHDWDRLKALAALR